MVCKHKHCFVSLQTLPEFSKDISFLYYYSLAFLLLMNALLEYLCDLIYKRAGSLAFQLANCNLTCESVIWLPHALT